MENKTLLLIFLQIFLIFGQAKSEEPMTCSISRYVKQTGLASDCFCAIAFLYDPSFPACAICRSCVVQPLDSKEVPFGGHTNKQGQPIPPSIKLARMNSAYDAVFPAEGYDGAPVCDHYERPAGLLLDPTYVLHSNDIYPTFLLGIQAGQGDVAMACNATLAAQVYKEAM
ncbi:uncharacterized protein MELLADRAFT_106947 [Melampsora larici-populina 98AG31]|uniref:Secreted protein n=1 Tax=Melampsora larici-populina (strain 98AG31 / pathotype 3-4-7) TaxID=747676 RepID=F4RN60_MELLP|nr:uncharacterized protein MELLADRAFT_106947 [Melampsora larici-populina 98AG31]EGG06242.1 secreted protein [Melampsora larici-populina 98AG31]